MKSPNERALQSISTWKLPYEQIAVRLIAWSPWLWLILFGLFILATTLQTGHLPTYGQPDPKDTLPSTLLYLPTIILLVAVVVTTPVGLVLTIAKLWKGFPKSARRRDLIFYVGGLGLFYLFVLSDLAGLMTWLAD